MNQKVSRTISIFLMTLAIASLSCGCSTVTYRDKGTAKIDADPDYSSMESYFLWGLVGEHHIDAKAACNGGSPRQLQAQSTFLDGFLSFITLGIYFPRHANVWCGGKSGVSRTNTGT